MDNIYALNIERAVLSSILFDYDIIEDILAILKPDDFYLPAHKVVFETMTKLHTDGLPIDEDFRLNEKMGTYCFKKSDKALKKEDK